MRKSLLKTPPSGLSSRLAPPAALVAVDAARRPASRRNGSTPYTGVPRETLMAKALFACDELCGFLTACALVQPSKSIADVKPASVKKKLKDKAFARSVSRDDIYNGAKELGADLEEHVAFIREALLQIADQIGLAGQP